MCMNDYTHGAIVIQLSTIEQGSRHAEEKKEELMAHINVSSEPYISGTLSKCAPSSKWNMFFNTPANQPFTVVLWLVTLQAMLYTPCVGGSIALPVGCLSPVCFSCQLWHSGYLTLDVNDHYDLLVCMEVLWWCTCYFAFFRFVDGCGNVVSKAPQLACGDRGSFAVTKAVRSTTTGLLKRPCHEGKFVVSGTTLI